MRIAIVTRRDTREGTGKYPAYDAWTEAEDVLRDTVDVDLVRLYEPIETASVRARRHTGRLMRTMFGTDRAMPPIGRSAKPLRSLTGQYDLVIFMAYSIWDLPLLERLGRVRDHADTVAVWFIETWPSTYRDRRVTQEPFHTVDRIFVGLDAAVTPLSKVLGRRVDYLPLATDTLRFGPARPGTRRAIDLIGLGRRRADQHETFLDWANEHDRLYLHDTTAIGRPLDPDSHRDAIGRWYSQSKLATCNYAQHDNTNLIGELRCMPGRLWEGLAAGAALIGDAPSTRSQIELFGKSVVAQVPDDLRALPRFAEDQLITRSQSDINEQVRLALTGHDWAHRWRQMFQTMALPVPDELQDRIDALALRADKFV